MTRSDFDSDRAADPCDWNALTRFVSGESTADETRAVRSWLGERPERARRIAALRQSIDGLAADGSDVDVEAALARVHSRMAEPTSRR